MRKPDKNNETLNLRVPEALMLALMRLAVKSDRSVSDYVRTVLADHCWGHVRDLESGDPSVDEPELRRSETGYRDV